MLDLGNSSTLFSFKVQIKIFLSSCDGYWNRFRRKQFLVLWGLNVLFLSIYLFGRRQYLVNIKTKTLIKSNQKICIVLISCIACQNRFGGKPFWCYQNQKFSFVPKRINATATLCFYNIGTIILEIFSSNICLKNLNLANMKLTIYYEQMFVNL